MNRDFLKEAIADAKAVKESAIANAKIALEEAFNPQLHAALSKKLEEMDGAYEEDDVTKKVNEDEVEEEIIDENISEEEVDEEMNLEELLNELEESDKSYGEDEISEEMDKKYEEDGVTEAEEAEEEEAGEAGEAEEGGEDEIDIEDMSEDDLKKFIEDVIEDMVEAGELEAGEGAEEEAEGEVDMDMDMEMEEEKEDLEEYDSSTQMIPDEKEDGTFDMSSVGMKEELNEAYATIKSLKSELQEINLLNAKLLYSNKIFKAKTLSESQKVKVLGTFDKATTVKEVKLVFETINESLKTKTTKRISENLIGSASRVTRTPKRAKKPILESNAMVSRFQKLAGITKN
jgi:hypothetical protein